MTMPTFTEELVFVQGATFDETYTINSGPTSLDQTPVDLSSYTSAKMQVRAEYGDATALVTITTAGAGIVLGGVAGTIRLIVSDEVTAALAAGNAVYDVALYAADGTVWKAMRGPAKTLPGVTTP